jgi:phosphonoacetate hydrolase
MNSSCSRRKFLAGSAAFAAAPVFAQRPPRRAVVIMCDGFGVEYLEASDMPTLARWRSQGIFRHARATMPSVTNTNNASICCGVWPEEHGITGNSYFDPRTGREEYMETSDLLLAPTLFQRAQKFGVRSALLSSKKKTTTLLSPGADLILTPEEPSKEWVDRLGPAPGIYSREINYWLMQAAIDVLKNRPQFGCLYVHTTDYPMHTWPPEAPESKEHLARLDQYFAEMAAAAPDAVFLLTADHGMNHKSRCWDLEKVCAQHGAPIRIAISVDRDKYVKHHRGYGGVAWVYCNSSHDIGRVSKALLELEGVESVLARSEAVRRFHLMPGRIGDLIVLGDRDTVFGELDAPFETLPTEYRAHGSLHEMDIPLVIYNAQTKLSAEEFQYNRDLARWLYA